MIELVIYKKDLTEELVELCKELDIELIVDDKFLKDLKKNYYFRVNNNLEIDPIEPPYDL